jgi:hypothetical protein
VERGQGLIATSWTKGSDAKFTSLRFASPDAQVVLDHSNEEITVTKNNSIVFFEKLKGDLSEMTRNYIHLLKHFDRCLTNGADNLKEAEELHNLLFSALVQGRGFSQI